MGCCESRDKDPVDLDHLFDDDDDELQHLGRKGSDEHVGEFDSEHFSHTFSLMQNHKRIDDVYHIEDDILGQGAAGVVREAQDKHTGAKRAIKTIDPRTLGNSAVVALKTEVSIMKIMDHPHVIKLYEVFNDAQYLYLVMELCTGGELFDRIVESYEKENGFTEFQAARYMRQILAAVSYIHKQQVVHRDIKPENFILQDNTPDALLKIIDFGIASKIKPKGTLEACLGTMSYCAPEVWTRKYDHKVDIWSAGVVLYILLCGTPPFFGDSVTVQRSIKHAKYSFPHQPWDHISNAAKDLVTQMIEKDPHKRPDAVDLLNHAWIESKTPRKEAPLPRSIISNFKAFARSQKLKRVSLTLIATQLKQSEIESLREQFEALDTNGDGTLSREELAQGLKTLNLSKQDMEYVMDIDSDGSGEIDWTEFIAAALDRKQYQSREVLWSAFRVFDLDGDGSITKAELKKVVGSSGGHHLPEDRVQELIADADEDGDGSISFDEFVRMMQK